MSDSSGDQRTAYGVALKMGPDSARLTVEYRIGDRKYTFWRYGDDELQEAAEVWVVRDDGIQLTVNVAQSQVYVGDGENSNASEVRQWDQDRDALIESANLFQMLYKKADRMNRRRQVSNARRVGVASDQAEIAAPEDETDPSMQSNEDQYAT